jgi:hypothetical protein
MARSQTESKCARRRATPSGSTWYTLRVPFFRSRTNPASFSTFRCCETAGLLTGNIAASSLTAIGPSVSC